MIMIYARWWATMRILKPSNFPKYLKEYIKTVNDWNDLECSIQYFPANLAFDWRTSYFFIINSKEYLVYADELK